MIFSPNSKRSVYMPEYHPPSVDYSQKKKPDVTDFLEPQWYRGRDYAYLATLPRYSASQHGSFFEIFKDYNMPTVPIPDGKMFRLPSYVVEAWSDFEEAAQATIGAIYSEANHPIAQITMLGSPSANGGYKSAHSSSEIVIRRAYASRLWFSLYIGALYWICMHGNTVKKVQNGKVVDHTATASDIPSAILSDGTTNVETRSWLPLWFLCVLSRNERLQPFLSTLRSIFSTFARGASFTGMFIRIKDIHEIGGLSFCIRHDVPIWYTWGPDEEELIREHPRLAHYRPPEQMIRDAYSEKKKKQEQETGMETNTDTDTATGQGNGKEIDYELDADEGDGGAVLEYFESYFRERSPSLPPWLDNRPPTPPSISSGQVEGESMQEFFRDRALADQVKMASETEEQFQLRWKREKTQGTRNTPIFGWQLNSAQCWIRVRLPSRVRALLEDEQSGFKKRYNAQRDELDFAPTFDPLPISPMDFDPSITPEDQYIDRQIQQSRRTRLPELVNRERVEEDWAADTALDVASRRYGFIALPDEVLCSQLTANELWIQVHQGLQLPGSAPNSCPQVVLPYVRNLHSFIQSFVEAAATTTADHLSVQHVSGPRPEIWDIHPDNDTIARPISVKNLIALPGHHFIIGKPDECVWTLVARNPVDAIHACRLRDSGFRVLDIAWHFIDRGIPFLTGFPSYYVKDRPEFERSSIEVRTDNHRFSQVDFKAYLRLRRSILRRPGVALAAFKHGGIVWRIARDELGKLTEDELSTGTDFRVGGEKFVELDGTIDRVLSDEEVAGICGVYHVATGMFRHF